MDTETDLVSQPLEDALDHSERNYNREKIRAAYEYAKELHAGQTRQSGEPYISHPVAVAEIVVGLGLDTDSVCAALLSMGAGYVIIPGLSIQSATEGLRQAPELLFNLEISPIMPVMSALVFSVLIGLAATWTHARVITQVLEEFQQIVLAVVTRVVIPILPFFIAGTFCGLAYEGSITKQLPVFLMVILIVMAGHYIWLAVLYGLAGAYSGSNPWEVVRHYGPAYLTAVGTMSSAATLAVALRCAKKSTVLRQDLVDFGIPLFANIHLCGHPAADRIYRVLRHDRVQGAVRKAAHSGHYGAVLLPAWHLRRGCSRRSRRHRYGLSGPDHQRSGLWQ